MSPPILNPVTDRPLSNLSRRTTGRLRRSTLVTLRWMAVTGQSLALIIVAGVLRFDFDVWPCVLIIALSAAVNIFVSFMWPLDRRAGDLESMAQLGFDLFQLSALLWFTGGMTNPFALLILAPVVTGATTLSRSVLIVLGTLAAGLSFSLLFYSAPLPWSSTSGFTLPFTFRLGTWFALIVGTIFTSLYAWRAASESRRMSEALAATEAVLAHEQKLSALGGMAAAAAHELGTPLATIQVTAKEMARELDADSPLGEDARLVLSQAKRCRDILQQLAQRGDEGDLIHDQLSLEALLEEAVEPFDDFGPAIDVRLEGEGIAPEIGRQSELLYGLKNLIENAVDFAYKDVVITGLWDAKRITIVIEDDGPGFDPNILTRLGEPYVSRRERVETLTAQTEKALDVTVQKRALQSGTLKSGEMGLGVFIAKTLIERTGGRVNFSRATELGGARVRIYWEKGALRGR